VCACFCVCLFLSFLWVVSALVKQKCITLHSLFQSLDQARLSNQESQRHIGDYLHITYLKMKAKMLERKDKNMSLLVPSHFSRQVTSSGI